MSLSDYTKSKVIGKGSYGEVWLAKHKRDKKQYVLKKLDLQHASKRERRAAEQEAKLLSKLKHPNIVSYKDSFETGNGLLYIAMGFCEGGDLYNKLKEQKGKPLEERQIVEWYVQISMALQYMHERNILHRDLKTQNIFLTKSKIIKLGDLGIARVLESPSDMASTLIGTPYYMSPELFSNKPYNYKSDVWALGCCVYEMATLKHAFNAKDMNSLVYKILRGKMPSMPKMYSTELIELIKAMLNQNPDRRPSVNRVLRDPYIKKNIALFLEGTKKSRSRPSSSRAAGKSERISNQKRDLDVPDSARSSASVASQAKSYDREKNRKASIDNDLEPLQVGPELTPIREDEETDEPRRRSNVVRKSNESKKPTSQNSRPNSGQNRVYDSNDYKPSARDKLSSRNGDKPSAANRDYKAPSYARSDNKAPSVRADRFVQPASKRADKSPESVRSSRSDRSVPHSSRSTKEPSPYRSKASPSPRRSADPSPRRSKDSKPKSRDKSPDSRSHSRSPVPRRDLPPRPKGHVRSSSDPFSPNKESSNSPTVERRQRVGSERSSVGSPALSEDATISSSRSSTGESKARYVRRKKRKSNPSSGDEPDPIAISCEDADDVSRLNYISNVNSHRDSSVVIKDSNDPVNDAYAHKQKALPLRKVESEPIMHGDDNPMSARARRREQKTLEETPRTNRSVDLDKNRRSMDFNLVSGRTEDQYRSEDYSKPFHYSDNKNSDVLDCTDGFEAIAEGPVGVSEKKEKARDNKGGAHGPRHRQPSVGSSSSSDAEDEESQPDQPHAKRKEEKEMNNFIAILNTTLRMNNVPNDDDDDAGDDELVQPPLRFLNGATYVKKPAPCPQIVIEDTTSEDCEDLEVQSPSADPQFAYPTATGKVTIPSGTTMTTTGRLWERITVLRKDCIRGLGVEKLKRAYDILDNVGHESMESQLVALLGRDDFDTYAGKIWQLKFCEEAAFGLV